jgi:hypothetical protein
MTAQVSALLDESRRELYAAMEGMHDEDFRKRSERGQWTAAEVLAHLLDHEARVIQAQDHAHMQQGRGAEPTQARRMPVPQLVHALLAQRRTTVRALQREADPSRTAAVAESLAAHEREHARQLVSLRKASE